ncbi:doubled CXXCH domain-containing protein [Pseudomonas segetis]|uniref:Doubled CXXCH domain-containing protein n=2 Tax=Pseudomonas segetis TaxID=298908 RepID=A0A239A9D5_9PSED|nr:doubled CXXCH domain-containing protein [Pseudomonas segetis]
MFYARTLLIGLLMVALGNTPLLANESPAPAMAQHSEGYAAEGACDACHTQQVKDWKGSDHDWAMRKATAESVLGNFNNATFKDGDVKARFFKRDNKYFVNIEGEDGKLKDFEIAYTFGHDPLQQYLVELDRGRLQSLTIAWDARTKAAGGQRWFSLYPGQKFTPDDGLHWTGRYQNWNAMCADCHSSNLQKNYDDKTDSFATTWHEQNVGCQSCHGPGQAHVDWAGKLKAQSPTEQSYSSAADIGLSVDFKKLGSHGLVEQCARCHSRRQSLDVGPAPGEPLLNAMLPSTLRPDLYHADGQIDGEVYVYGSFTQSKMFAAGVTCTDCHNPHSNKVKIEGNGLCLQCHTETPPERFPSLRAKNYDTPEHHHHPVGSEGAQCVNCHMPSKTYMVVDPRRDHSFRIPRPDLDEVTGSPDACTACHTDQKPKWAADAIKGWFGKPALPTHYGEAFQAVRQGHPDSISQLAGLIADMGKPEIVRATAADQLSNLGAPAVSALEPALKDDSAWVRASAASGFVGLAPVDRVKHLLPLMDDPHLAVRDEAVRALAGIPLIALPKDRREDFQAALKDYEKRLRGNADLPGNRLNLAVLMERQGRVLEALEQYREALKLDPYFSPARVNLVTLANNNLRQDEAIKALREGLALPDMPKGDHGNLAYMFALLLVESGKPEEGLKWMSTAAEELPDNPRVLYNQGLLYMKLQQPEQAVKALEASNARNPNDADVLYALLFLNATSGNREKAAEYFQRMQQVAPNDPRLQQLQKQGGPR